MKKGATIYIYKTLFSDILYLLYPFYNYAHYNINCAYENMIKDCEGELKMGKITRIKGIDDVVLGIGIFGLSALVLGVAMIYGALSGFSLFTTRGVAASTLVLNTLFNGISFLICSVLFFIVSALVLFTIRTTILLKAMEIFSLAGTLFVAFSFIRELFFVRSGYEILVTLSAMLISSFLFYIVRGIVKVTLARMENHSRSGEGETALKNAG